MTPDRLSEIEGEWKAVGVPWIGRPVVLELVEALRETRSHIAALAETLDAFYNGGADFDDLFAAIRAVTEP